MVHGSADDNVHFQHTAQFAKALTEAQVDFRLQVAFTVTACPTSYFRFLSLGFLWQVYFDERHMLEREHTRKHLYMTMTHFLMDSCWGGAKPREWRKGEYHEVDLALLAWS